VRPIQRDRRATRNYQRALDKLGHLNEFEPAAPEAEEQSHLEPGSPPLRATRVVPSDEYPDEPAPAAAAERDGTLPPPRVTEPAVVIRPDARPGDPGSERHRDPRLEERRLRAARPSAAPPVAPPLAPSSTPLVFGDPSLTLPLPSAPPSSTPPVFGEPPFTPTPAPPSSTSPALGDTSPTAPLSPGSSPPTSPTPLVINDYSLSSPAAGEGSLTPFLGGRSSTLSRSPLGRVPGLASPRPAHLRSRHRRGRRPVVLGVGAVVVAIGAAAGVYTLTDNTPSHAATPPVSKPAPKTRVTLPVTTTVPAPTTTAPPAFSLVSNVGGTATYQVAAAAPITLRATGPCWVDAHQANSSGASVFTATMAAGQTQTLTAPVWIRLGAPAAVAIEVNGTTLTTPATGGAPLDVELQ
jgi:Domain of unknown function (DUF4115)